MMKIYDRLHVRRFIQRGNAGISIMFAIILPVLIATFSLGIDGSRFLIKRARLADALSQGSFAVASTNSNLTTEPEKIEGKDLVRSYISYYIPGNELDESTLNVSANIEVDPDDSAKIKSIEYISTAKIIAHPIIDGISRALPGFNKDVPISADENNGIVSKTMADVDIESDIAFAVDFSASILDKSDDGKTHLEVLRDVVNDLATQIVDEASNSKIALIPFDLAVPTKIEEKNEANGDRIGCIVPYKLNANYQIDYAFWANKKVDWQFSGLTSPGNTREEFVKRYLDLKRYEYYSKYIKAAIGDSYKKYCTENISYDPTAGIGKIDSNPLSCEANGDVSATSPVNYSEIQRSYKTIEQFYHIELDLNMESGAVTEKSVDFAGTLSGDHLFNDNSMSRLEVPFATRAMGNMFKGICMSGFNIKSPVLTNTGVTIPKGHPWGDDNYYSTYLKDLRQNSYVIGLTNKKSDVDKFSNMNPVEGAGTDILSGLLYSAHEVAKGKNPRKIIIIVTDGQTQGDIKRIETKFLASDMCKKITDGIVKHSPGTKEAKIYFVSILNDSAVLSNWRSKCVGDDGAFVATDYSSLKNAITSVLSQEPGGIKFTNKK